MFPVDEPERNNLEGLVAYLLDFSWLSLFVLF